MDNLPPVPITSLTPELEARLRKQALDVLSYLVKTNSVTTYFKESSPVERDAFAATLKIPNYSSPIAVSFISNYKSFLFMHALFALVEPKLETINTVFATSCHDLCRTIDDHWVCLINCIETGVIPDIDGIENVKDNLQVRLCVGGAKANHGADSCSAALPSAENLRQIGKATGTPGWFRQIWPQLCAILANANGPFATVIPEIQRYIGPDVSVETLVIASSEAWLAVAYDPRDLNLYKVVGSDNVIEFLPVDKPEESKYLAQSWNVETGRKYEVVLTTRDGFWRYRLGDPRLPRSGGGFLIDRNVPHQANGCVRLFYQI
ncbi:GH3 auxin-responsive promoter-domain-containing protein [Pisolithus marmoratus]|nr:GH3 auxin-responsive promoter-domain-containing protein [Pisolithus marmoratus]